MPVDPKTGEWECPLCGYICLPTSTYCKHCEEGLRPGEEWEWERWTTGVAS